MSFSLLAQPTAITGESPLWDDHRQCLWWIDIQAQRLLQTQPDGATTTTALPWQPGFVALAASHRLVIGLENGVWAFDPDTHIWEQLSDTESERPTLRLNDGKPDAQGRLWFGSMDMTGQGLASGRLYCRETDGTITTVCEGITIPNAIVPVGDGHTLWFADSPTQTLENLHFEVGSSQLQGREAMYRFDSDLHPDGACLDLDGNLWVAVIGSGEVLQISSTGALLSRHNSQISRATMPMLGGINGHSLFLTNQRRFLSAQGLIDEPCAGGLLVKTVSAKAAPVNRVAGV